VEANSTGGQGSLRAVAPSGGGGGDDYDDCSMAVLHFKMKAPC
jgi:hypothetical protein